MSSCLFFPSYVAMQIDSQQIVTRKYFLNVFQNVSRKAFIFYIDTQLSEKYFYSSSYRGKGDITYSIGVIVLNVENLFTSLFFKILILGICILFLRLGLFNFISLNVYLIPLLLWYSLLIFVVFSKEFDSYWRLWLLLSLTLLLLEDLLLMLLFSKLLNFYSFFWVSNYSNYFGLQ